MTNNVTRTELKALDVPSTTVAYLTETGREGMFVWRAGNYSTLISLDTAEGVYIKANAVAASSGAWERVHDGMIRPKWFGAAVDNITDDAAAANACAEFCAATGHTFVIQRGAMRVTGPVKFGLSYYDSLAFAIERTKRISDVAEQGSRNAANVSANIANRRPCGIHAESGSVVVADFSPVAYQAVLEYNLGSPTYRHKVDFTGPITVATPAFVADNFGNVSATGINIPPVNNLIGLGVYGSGVVKRVETLHFFGMGSTGLLAPRAYWSRFKSVVGWACGTVADLPGANAAEVDVEAWYSTRGLVCDGDNLRAYIDTENVGTDLRVYHADCGVFTGGYLEDAVVSDGTGLYAVDLGEDAGDTTAVAGCTFIGLRVGSVRTNKKAFRLNGLGSINTFIGCREYSHGIDADNVSRAVLINTDFVINETNLPIDRFGRIQESHISATSRSLSPTGARVRHTDLISVNSFDYGSIAAGASVTKDLTIPARPTVSASSLSVTVTSGGSDLCIRAARLLNSTTVRLIITNPTASPINYGMASHNIRIDGWLGIQTSVAPT